MFKQNVIIIEDDADTAALIFKLLQNIGYKTEKILICLRLNDALKLRPNDIEIIITDLTLPDSTCNATFKTLSNFFPYHPIIVLSGSSEMDIVEQTLNQGAQDYLIKGDIDQKGLFKSIKYAIERKKTLNDYRRVFEESPAPMYIYEEKTYKFLAVNNAALHQYEYGREEFMALTSMDIRPLEEIKRFVDANVNVPSTYNDFGTWKHLQKNGEILFVHVYAHATEFEGKKAKAVLAINIDNKVKAEMNLQEKAKEINIILDSITDGFFAVNYEWEFTYVNRECERMFRRDKAELLGKNAWTAFPGRQQLKFYTEYKRALTENVSVHFEEYDAQLGGWFSVNAYPTKTGLAVYFIDISEKRKLEEETFVNEQNLRSIINNTKDVIWSIDRNNNIISANDAFWNKIREKTGSKTSKVSAKNFGKKLFDEWSRYYKKAFEGNTLNFIYTDEHNDKEVYEEININPIYDRTNNVIGISCFSRDVTERHLHMKMIEKQNDQLRKIAWIQSHEVRAPVANILGLVKLFNHHEPADAINKKVLGCVEQSAVKLDEVIRKLTSHTIIQAN
jgi:PAS domain S-box-containing protein